MRSGKLPWFLYDSTNWFWFELVHICTHTKLKILRAAVDIWPTFFGYHENFMKTAKMLRPRKTDLSLKTKANETSS